MAEKHSQKIFTTAILIKILAASFFFDLCDNKKSTLRLQRRCHPPFGHSNVIFVFSDRIGGKFDMKSNHFSPVIRKKLKGLKIRIRGRLNAKSVFQ